MNSQISLKKVCDALKSLLDDSLQKVLEYIESRGLPMKLKIVLEPSEDGGHTAYVPSLPGCISEGDSQEEALKNIREAIELYLEPVDDDSHHAPDAETVEIAV